MRRLLHPGMSFLLPLLCWLGAAGQGDSLVTTGKASFYGDAFHGLETSSGDIFDAHDFTAAHRTLPFGTIVSVTNKNNGKNVIVRVNDRGPFVKSRIIDLSKSAARKIGMVPYGVVPVRIQVLDLLDNYPLSDSLLHDGDTWDCYGKRRPLHGPSVFAWSTRDVRHALYMATGMALDYHCDSVRIEVAGPPDRRQYHVYITALPSDPEAKQLVGLLRKNGFSSARFISSASVSAGRLRGGQSAK
jgi:rare lipoprotein A